MQIFKKIYSIFVKGLIIKCFYEKINLWLITGSSKRFPIEVGLTLILLMFVKIEDLNGKPNMKLV